MNFHRQFIALGITILLFSTIFPLWHTDDAVTNLEIIPSTEQPYSEDDPKYPEPTTRGPRLGKLASVKTACEISDEGMKTAKAMLERAWTENITEGDVVRAIDQRMVELGSSSQIDAFGLLVVSGNDTGEPGGHGTGDPDDETNQILPGEVVFIDIGARYNGYVSDLTRTFFMGEPTDEQRKVYKIIQDAQNAGVSVIQHGVQAKEVDLKARKVIEDAGYGEYFSHAVGHGIGLYIHTFPPVSSSSEITLSKARDDIITVEPGIYIPDDFGIRIEDDYIVDWFGSELITFYPRDIENAIIFQPEEEEPVKKGSSDKGGILGMEAGSLGIVAGIAVLALIALFIIIRNRAKIRKSNED